MYNGIGLTTARGSGTNGYVQRNLAFIQRVREKVEYKPIPKEKLERSISNVANNELLLHDSKKKLEIKVQEMEELMEDQGFEQEEIDEKVSLFRAMLMQTLDNKSIGGVYADKDEIDEDEFGRPITKNTHQMIRARDIKNKLLKDAFSIQDDYVFGSAFAQIGKKEEDVKKEPAQLIHTETLPIQPDINDMQIISVNPENMVLEKYLEKQLLSSDSEIERKEKNVVRLKQKKKRRIQDLVVKEMGDNKIDRTKSNESHKHNHDQDKSSHKPKHDARAEHFFTENKVKSVVVKPIKNSIKHDKHVKEKKKDKDYESKMPKKYATIKRDDRSRSPPSKISSKKKKLSTK